MNMKFDPNSYECNQRINKIAVKLNNNQSLTTKEERLWSQMYMMVYNDFHRKMNHIRTHQ